MYGEDWITLTTACLLVAFTFIKLIHPLPYLHELTFTYPISLSEKWGLIKSSLHRFSLDFFRFLDNFFPFDAPPKWALSAKFAVFILLCSAVWSLWTFRKNSIQALLVLCIFFQVGISLLYHPMIDPHTPVDRFFYVWVPLPLALFIQDGIWLGRRLIRKSSHPRGAHILLTLLGCIFVLRIVSYQLPRWDDFRDRTIARHSIFYYDPVKISTFMNMAKKGEPIGYAYETDAYVSLLHGGFSNPANLLYITQEKDLSATHPIDNINLVAASNNLAHMCTPTTHVILKYNFQPGKYEAIFDNPLQRQITVKVVIGNSSTDFKIPPHTKHYHVKLDIGKSVDSLSFSTTNGFAILRGFLLQPSQEHFWPWGEDFEVSSQVTGKPPASSINLRDKFLNFGPDLRGWRILDDTTGLIFFARN